MTGPDDSSLMAKAITNRSGKKNKSAIAEKEMSTILFRIKPLIAVVGREGSCAADFVSWTLLWRIACPSGELCRPRACGRW
jgi:hypothetical protein